MASAGEGRKESGSGELSPDQVQRLFVGVPLPQGLLAQVKAVQAEISHLPGIRLSKPEQLHVTLAFLGHVGPEAATEARRVVSESAVEQGGRAVLGRVLPLPSARRARVVALEITDEARVFERLFGRVMGGLEQAGVMQREKRRFQPHLTIARLKPPAFLEPKYEWSPAEYEVESVCLYRSELRPEGARYTVLEMAELIPPE